MAMGFAAPAQSRTRGDDSTASAASLDTALVAASARRARVRGASLGIDGQPSGHAFEPFSLFHALWLTAAPSFPPPDATAVSAIAQPVWEAPATAPFASRTSRGPPPRS